MFCVSIVPFSQGVVAINIYIHENINKYKRSIVKPSQSKVALWSRNDWKPDSASSVLVLISDVAAKLGGQIVDGVDSRSCFHGGQPVQKSPVALGHHLHQEDLQQDLGKLFPYAHPGAASERNVLEPAGVAGRLAQEALGTEVLFVGEHLGHVVRVADAVDDVPAFGNLVALVL